MVRESGISATKPLFPTFLLPSFRFPFRRRHSSVSSITSESSSSPTCCSPTSSLATTPSNSPPKPEAPLAAAGPPHQDGSRPKRLSRTGADTLRCLECSTDLAFASQIVSKGFTGRHGRAFLVSPSTSSAPVKDGQSLLNIRVGRSENRQLVTGWHVVADISCAVCSQKLGWKYVDATDPSQKYKIGKFILETRWVVSFRNWHDVDVVDKGTFDEVEGDEDDREDEIEFDSQDEDECDDIFAGTWDAETVARRRSRRGKMMPTSRDEEMYSESSTS